MEISLELLICLGLSMFFGGIIMYCFHRIKYNNLKDKLAILSSEQDDKVSELLRMKTIAEQFRNDMWQLEKENTVLTAELKNTRCRLQEELQNESKNVERFENIANKVLKVQSEAFNHRQFKGMKDILSPLQDRIGQFEAKVESTNKESIARHSSLKQQIHHLSQQSDKVAKDANNLAKALKGDYKKQGNWGEVVLKNILDKSGLEKDREYAVQVSERDVHGRLQKPDVVIMLPDQKKLIIDSKVSLVAYDRLMSSDCEEGALVALKAHKIAVKKHIDDLSSKNYHDLYKMESPDFVLMFIPIDTAFSVALEKDPNLYGYAFDRNIVIVTPSTLLATLKTVETMWRNDKQNRYAMQIAYEAGRMYDKFVGFVEDMEKMGVQINTVQKTYLSTMGKLMTGQGNVINKAEKIKSLGAKANKNLSQAHVQGAID